MSNGVTFKLSNKPCLTRGLAAYMEELKKREIGLYGLTMIAIGSSIGSGIFKTPSEIAGYLPAEGLMLAVWMLGGLIALEANIGERRSLDLKVLRAVESEQ